MGDAGSLYPAPKTLAQALSAVAAATNDQLRKRIAELEQEPLAFETDGLRDACREELENRFRLQLAAGPLSDAEVKTWIAWLDDEDFVKWHVQRAKKSAGPVVINPAPPSGS